MRLILVGLAALMLCHAADRTPKRENIEWTDVWFPNSKDHDLPRVALIGDSITRAYYSAVEANLKGKAYCARIATSKAVGDPALAAQIAMFLSEEQFDVVHFNIGMHGWEYTEDDYRQYLPELLAAIRKGAPHAKLVFGTTTPVRADRPQGASNERIANRNRIAREFFAKQAIPIDDLHAAITGHDDLHSDDVHYKTEGSRILADSVTKSVEPLLAR
jgi:hypothetical protein